MLLDNLLSKKLIHPPEWLPNNTMYMTIMGSHAYGCPSNDSDMDIYGFCIPPKDYVFPHFAGYVYDFSTQIPKFHQWSQHHIKDEQALGGRSREYDISIYGIVRYFRLLMENNPNIIDSIFTPRECVIHSTQIAELVRENRKLFLHKGCWHKYKGYSYSQLHKMSSKDPIGKRKEIREQYGFDLKFGMHCVRLLLQCQQIMEEGDLDLQRNKEQLKAIKRGEVDEQYIKEWFTKKEKQLEELYSNSKLPYGPPEGKIKSLLLKCLEHHYGSLDKCVVDKSVAVNTIRQINNITQQFLS